MLEITIFKEETRWTICIRCPYSTSARAARLRGPALCCQTLSREHQYMNIFVPAVYLHADGTVNEKGVCNGYTAKTAPIILVNGCAGWMSSTSMEAMFDYLQEGFVHISVGARSRELDPAGRAPSACVDQKAAVRMLRLNDLTA